MEKKLIRPATQIRGLNRRREIKNSGVYAKYSAREEFFEMRDRILEPSFPRKSPHSPCSFCISQGQVVYSVFDTKETFAIFTNLKRNRDNNEN